MLQEVRNLEAEKLMLLQLAKKIENGYKLTNAERAIYYKYTGKVISL